MADVSPADFPSFEQVGSAIRAKRLAAQYGRELHPARIRLTWDLENPFSHGCPQRTSTSHECVDRRSLPPLEHAAITAPRHSPALSRSSIAPRTIWCQQNDVTRSTYVNIASASSLCPAITTVASTGPQRTRCVASALQIRCANCHRMIWPTAARTQRVLLAPFRSLDSATRKRGAMAQAAIGH